MSKDKEIESENETDDSCRNDCYVCSEKGVLVGDSGTNFFFVSSHGPPPEKIRVCETSHKTGPNRDVFSSSNDKDGTSSGVEPQDADYPYVPSLSDELEVSILARVPRSEYWKFCFVNKHFLSLLKSGEIFKIRREFGFKESSVFMLASGESRWWAFDRQFKSRRKLPDLPSDMCFTSGDKESLCAGTHLIVSGREIDGVVVWRYELETNQWFKGPPMINPRCLFASATCGTYGFVAGGIGMETREVLNSAEKYNPETKSWEPLPRMQRKRKLCSGCYMDNKFYVIGGRNEEEKVLTCGEAFDMVKNTWEPIPDMLKGTPVASAHESPPLVAVVNNELYSLETSSNELRVYLKRSNTWRKLGQVPVRADTNRGWGVAFKSLGNELLVIGASSISYAGHGVSIYTCCPDPGVEELRWKPLECGQNRLSHFILNCSIMVV